MTEPTKKVLTFRFDDQTKGTYKYREVDDATNKVYEQYGSNALIGTLYVRKEQSRAFIGASYPYEFQVTLEVKNWDMPH